jgi:hypothetical protein
MNAKEYIAAIRRNNPELFDLKENEAILLSPDALEEIMTDAFESGAAETQIQILSYLGN